MTLLAMNDVMDLGLANAVLSSEFALEDAALPIAVVNGLRVDVRDTSVGMTFPPRQPFGVQVGGVPIPAGGSPFPCHVTHVHCSCSQEEMVRPYANAVIAVMADEEPAGNRSKVQLPREAMHSEMCGFVFADEAISIRPSATHPLPTPVGLLNFSPKPSL